MSTAPRRPTTSHAPRSLALATLAALACATSSHAQTPSNVTIDLLVVYTPGANNLYGGGAGTRINHVINVTNQALADSEVGITLRLAQTQSVAYSDTPNSNTALSTFRNNTAPFASVESWRTQFGADMVVLMRPYCGDGIAGIAYVNGLGRLGNLTGLGRSMYSHVAINTADYVLAHELGHNFGLVHSRKQDPSGGTFHYAAGYGVQTQFVDIMAYGSAFGVGDAQKVYQYSNPRHTVNGWVIGVAQGDTTNGADASASLNSVRAYVAAYLPSKQYLASRVGQFGGDARSDLYRFDPDDGATYAWITGSSVAPTDGFGDDLQFAGSPAARLVSSGDWDGDGDSDVLFRTAAVTNRAWLLGSGTPDVLALPNLSGSYWQIAGAGDLDGDGDDDLVWRNYWNGNNRLWVNDGSASPSIQVIPTVADVAFRIDGLGDFDGDGKCDLFWRHTTQGKNTVWLMNGAAIKSQAPTTAIADLATRVAGSGDFDGDGDDDLLFNNTSSGANAIWYMNGTAVGSTASAPAAPALRCVGIGDFDADGRRDDPVWNDAAAEEDFVWLMNGATPTSQASLKSGRELLDDVQVAADLDGDGKSDLVWRQIGSGANTLWRMNGSTVASQSSFDTLAGSPWRVARAGDFDGDGKQDLLWRNLSTGAIKVWRMDGASVLGKHDLPTVPDLNTQIATTGDLDGDGKDDVVFRHATTGVDTAWLMNGGATPVTRALTAVADLNWKLVEAEDWNADGKDDLVWHHNTNGKTSVWLMNGSAVTSTLAVPPVADLQWRLVAARDFDGDLKPDLFWRHATNGNDAIWFMNGATRLGSSGATTAVSDLRWTVEDVGDFDADGRADILWNHGTTQTRVLWLMNGLTVASTTTLN